MKNNIDYELYYKKKALNDMGRKDAYLDANEIYDWLWDMYTDYSRKRSQNHELLGNELTVEEFETEQDILLGYMNAYQDVIEYVIKHRVTEK